MNFGHVYMIGFILFIGVLVGMVISVAVQKDIERQDERERKEMEDMIERQAHKIEVLTAKIVVLEDALKGGEHESIG